MRDIAFDYLFGLPGNKFVQRLVYETADDIRTRCALKHKPVLRGYAEALSGRRGGAHIITPALSGLLGITHPYILSAFFQFVSSATLCSSRQFLLLAHAKSRKNNFSSPSV
ncbi:hypothetical protein [Mesorhizobium sp. M0130]|uniref:hypothetical protein n=1 Tax=Mesorhizobium sp. M0130 TaxID=2956887 RepID=UPI00333AFEA6